MFLSQFSLLAYFLYSVTLIGLLERKCVLCNLCLVLIDLRIPLVIHGLVHNYSFFWDNCLIGAWLSAIDLTRSVILVAVSCRSLL